MRKRVLGLPSRVPPWPVVLCRFLSLSALKVGQQSITIFISTILLTNEPEYETILLSGLTDRRIEK